MARTAYLLNINVTLKGRELQSYTFAEEEILIGRDPHAQISLDNMGVSRRQARITSTPTGYLLEDLESSNGTLLNERRIGRSTLSDGDVIGMGKISLRVHLEPLTIETAAEAWATDEVDETAATQILNKRELETLMAGYQRKAASSRPAEIPLEGMAGTAVITPDQLDRMRSTRARVTRQRASSPDLQAPLNTAEQDVAKEAGSLTATILVAALVGIAIGGVVVFFFLR